MASKTDTEVIIGGKVFTLSGYESEEYLQKVASYINNKINEYSKIESFKKQPAEMQNFLRHNLPVEVKATFPFERVAPHILHLQLPPFDGAVVAGLLSERDVAVSAGSACTAEAKTPSPSLKALRIKNPFSVLRLSFSADNTLAECEKFCQILREVLQNY